ncbi:hypothetical protein CcCBS67573_g04787 [Chytriomyces confervae]|uniref:Uncharacterized protein n=1 Tax=Chytriomyces confervae TaxID=246404 RepID=A0A507FF76_9FUNG|nr:hypothetical protein CcCBS67573_g04787 [Chytriomyces confervae]
MGSCNSSLEDDAAAKAASKSIDAQLKLEENEIKRTAKLLLLGAGETGKSTVLKQMRMIYNIPFNEIELSLYRTGMVLNLVTCAKTLAQSMEKLQIPYGFHKPEESVDEGDELSGSPGLSHGKTLKRESTPLAKQEVVEVVAGSAAAKVTSRPQDPYARYARELYLAQKEGNHQSCCSFNAAKYIQECDISFCFGGGNTVPEELVNAIKILWEDSGVQYCFSRSSEYQLMDSCAYVMSDPVRICSAEYKPTEEDILRVRIMTVKINEVKFSAQGTTFQVVDVGGQRSERKKWIPYFEDARAIIYMVALNSYDQTCFEDSVTNRITESLTLFNTIAHHPILKDTSIILFLNKIDLFKAKLLEVPVASYFPDYTGSNDIESASKYFDGRFRHENTYTKRAIFTHLTWATDKEQISNIISSSSSGRSRNDSSHASSSEVDSRGREIERRLKEDKEKSKKEVKILLLGTGETGKSTVLKQMKLIHKIGFTSDEIATFRSALILNIISCAQDITNAMDKLGIPYEFDPTQVSCNATTMSRQLTESSLTDPAAIKDACYEYTETRPHCSDSIENPTMRRRTPRFKEIAAAASELLACQGGIEHRKGETAGAAALIRATDPSRVLSESIVPPRLISSIKLLWQDCGVQYCVSRSSEYQLMDSCPYIMENLDRICRPEFTPADADILAARVMTSHIREIRFKVNESTFCVYDLGGQRSERKKWMAHFDNVKAFIYMVAISSYDQMCFEDSQTNRIAESLNLFHSLTHHPALKRTCIILFLNKIDLFKEKLKTTPLVDFFPEYKGPDEYEEGAKFFEHIFRDENKFKERDLFTHFTWATDTKQISNVLETVTLALLRSAFEDIGLL